MRDFARTTFDHKRESFEDAGRETGLAAPSIEKDFWVCWTLRELFGLPDWNDRLTLKGGTSLSKGWKIIKRFSEDPDLVIDREFLGFGGEFPGSKREKKLRVACKDCVQNDIYELLTQHFKTLLEEGTWSLSVAGKTEDPDEQTLLFQYQSVFAGSLAYVRPVVKMEFGARGEPRPKDRPTITPYVAEVFPKRFKEPNCTITALAPPRTFWEKVLLLHEERYRPARQNSKDKAIPPLLRCLLSHQGGYC